MYINFSTASLCLESLRKESAEHSTVKFPLQTETPARNTCKYIYTEATHLHIDIGLLLYIYIHTYKRTGDG